MNQETNNILNQHTPEKHIKSFGYAFSGLKHVFLKEANFRVHTCFALITLLFAYILKFTYTEWALLILTIGSVLTAEIINSSIEALIDHLIKEHHDGVRIIKDTSAAFVLMAAIISVFVGILLFAPKLINIFS